MSNGFLLGAHHGMGNDEVDYVCEVLKEFDELSKKESATASASNC